MNILKNRSGLILRALEQRFILSSKDPSRERASKGNNQTRSSVLRFGSNEFSQARIIHSSPHENAPFWILIRLVYFSRPLSLHFRSICCNCIRRKECGRESQLNNLFKLVPCPQLYLFIPTMEQPDQKSVLVRGNSSRSLV